MTLVQEPRERGRPRKHPSWTDEQGNSRAFTDHPNWNVTREVLRRLPEAVCPAFQDHVAFTYGVADQIGMKPCRYCRLETVEPDDLFSRETVLWWCEPWSSRRVASHAFRDHVRDGDPRARAALHRLVLSGAEDRELRRYLALAQRGFRDCDCLLPSYECDLHEAARRADDTSRLLPENESAVTDYERATGGGA